MYECSYTNINLFNLSENYAQCYKEEFLHISKYIWIFYVGINQAQVF